MKKNFYIRTALSLTLAMGYPYFFLQAETTTFSNSTKESQTASPSDAEDPSTRPENQEEMAAWILDSAQVAKDYVETLDKGLYSQSWTKGDKLFQDTITQEEWVKALGASRKPLGRMQSRTLNLQGPAWNPQRLPKGLYMVVQYNTSFEKSPSSAELITLRLGSDGKWRVLTYQVR